MKNCDIELKRIIPTKFCLRLLEYRSLFYFSFFFSPGTITSGKMKINSVFLISVYSLSFCSVGCKCFSSESNICSNCRHKATIPPFKLLRTSMGGRHTCINYSDRLLQASSFLLLLSGSISLSSYPQCSINSYPQCLPPSINLLWIPEAQVIRRKTRGEGSQGTWDQF